MEKPRPVPSVWLFALALCAAVTVSAFAAPAPAAPKEAPESPASSRARSAYAGAIALAQDGDTAGAIEKYTQVIAIEPGFAMARFERGRLRAESADLNAAINDFHAAAKGAPRNSWLAAEASLERARCLFAQLDYAGAASGAADVLAIRPDSADALALRAACRNELGQPYVALEDAQQAVALDDSLGRAWLEQGRAFAALRKPDKAIQSLTRAIDALGTGETETDDRALVTAHTLRGQTFDSIGRIREAIADFTRAIALDPAAYDARVGRALSLSRLGRNAEAIADCEQAVSVAPANMRKEHPAALLLERLRGFGPGATSTAGVGGSPSGDDGAQR